MQQRKMGTRLWEELDRLLGMAGECKREFRDDLQVSDLNNWVSLIPVRHTGGRNLIGREIKSYTFVYVTVEMGSGDIHIHDRSLDIRDHD